MMIRTAFLHRSGLVAIVFGATVALSTSPVVAQTGIAKDLAEFSAAVEGEDYSRAGELAALIAGSDLSGLPFNDAQRRDLQADLAAAFAANGEPARAASMMSVIILAELAVMQDTDNSALASELRAVLVARYELLASYETAAGNMAAAVEARAEALELTRRMYGPDRVEARFALRAYVDALDAAGTPVDARLRAELADLDGAAATPGLGSLGGGGANAKFETVRIHYGSTRLDTGRDNPQKAFSVKRQRPGSPVSYGTVTVTVPKDRTVGTVPRPSNWDPRGARDGFHIVLKRIDRAEGAEDFQQSLGRQLSEDATDAPTEAFVFVHGHGTPFASAAQRTAQLAVDLDMRAGGVFYDWPSAHGAHDYQRSQNNVEVAVDGLVDMLRMVSAEADEVHVIAHSMGNRVLLRALDELADDGAFAAGPAFDNIVWASPDVDQEVFSRRVRDVLGAASRMTLYASAKDEALKLSRFLGGDYPRAGQSPIPAAVSSVVEAVDTTPLAGGAGINHSDYVGGAFVDLQAVIWLSLMPEARCPLSMTASDGEKFWQIAQDRRGCDEQTFRRAIVARRAYGADATAQIEALVQQLEDSGDARAASWRNVLNVLERL